jgi:hypothetical protein
VIYAVTNQEGVPQELVLSQATLNGWQVFGWSFAASVAGTLLVLGVRDLLRRRSPQRQ